MSTSTITGSIKDASGTGISGVSVTARLRPAGFRTSDYAELTDKSATTDASGNWSLALERNADISPSGTWYEIEEQIPSSSGGGRQWAINADANGTLFARLVTPPPANAASFLTSAAADARYGVGVTNIDPVGQFGLDPTGASDCTSAFNTMAAALASGEVQVNFRPGIYLITNLNPINHSRLILNGNGATLRKTNAGGDGLTLAGTSSAAYMVHPKILNLRFAAAVTQTVGYMLKVSHCQYPELAGVFIDGAYRAVAIWASEGTQFHDGVVHNSVDADVEIASPSESWKCIDTYLVDLQLEGTPGNTTKTALDVRSGTSGLYATNVVAAQGSLGVLVENNAGGDGNPQFLFFNQTLTDQTNSTGWALNAGDSIDMNGCWGCTSFGDVGVNLNGARSVRLRGGRYMNNFKQGILVGQSFDHLIDGPLVSGNSGAGANTYDGIAVGAGATKFQIVNVRAANLGSPYGSGTQRYGIAVAAGASDYYVIANNLLQGNGTGGLSDGGTGIHKSVVGNVE